MQFGRHIGKGLWAFADKTLPVLYGLGLVFLVARVLPREEYGAFVLVQTVFNIFSAFTYTIALQPLTKFAAETDRYGGYAAAALILQLIVFFAASLILLLVRGPVAHVLDPSGQTHGLLIFVPLLLAASLYRNFSTSYLQSHFSMQRIFWINTVYFLGTMMVVAGLKRAQMLHSAAELLGVSAVAYACSSLLAVFLTPVKFEISGLRKSLRTMWQFGKFLMGGNIAYMLYSQADVFVATSFGGPAAAASYYNAKLFTRFFDLQGQVLQSSLVPLISRLTQRKSAGELVAVVEKSVCFSLIVLAPVFLVMFFLPQPLLHVMFRGRYEDSAPMVRIFSFLALLVPWNGTAVSYLIGSGRVKPGMWLGLLQLVVGAVLYLILTYLLGVQGLAVGFVLTIAILTIFLIVLVRQDLPLTAAGVLRRSADVWRYFRSWSSFFSDETQKSA